MIRSDNPPDNGVSGAMYLFGTALLWSFIGILVRANSQSALLIGAVTAIFMALFILLVGRPVLRVSRLIVLVAVCNFVTGTTFNFANQLTTVGNAIVLQYTSMIFVIVYQSLATRTLPSPAKIASVLVAFTGMGLFFLGDLSAEGMLGNLLAVISGATFGLCFFLNSRPDASPMVSSLISCGISMLPIVYFAGALDSVRPFEWGLMLVHGLFCSGLASVLYAKGIARTNAFAANLVCMSEVVLAPCWSALFFGEVFRWNEFLGAAIIVLVIVANMAVGIGSMVYVGTDMLGVAIIGQAINGLAWGFLEPLQMILIQERADIKYLGRITGFVRFGLMSAGVVPLLAAPFLAEALGVQTVLFGASTIIALVGTLFFVTQGRRRGR